MITVIQPFKPLTLEAAPVNYTGRISVTGVDFEGGATAPYLLEYTTQFNGRKRYGTPSSILPNLYWNGTKYIFDNVTHEWESEINAASPWEVETWTQIAGGAVTGPTVTNADLGDIASFIGQLAHLTVDDNTYTFRALSTPETTWEAATPGLLYDPTPVTGSARWRKLVFTGTGDDHTTTYEDL